MTRTFRTKPFIVDWKRTRIDGFVTSRPVNGSVNNVVINRPNSVSRGAWKDMGNGHRFRLPTSYGVSKLALTAGADEMTSGFQDNHFYSYKISTKGGSDPSQVCNQNMSGDLAPFLNDMRSPPNIVDSERNEAVTKCLNKLADQKVNIAENLATLSQTVRLFTKPTRTFIQGLAKFRRKDFNGLLRYSYRQLRQRGIPESIAEDYLAYVYGIKPLMQDIYGIAELAKEQGLAPLMLNASAKAVRDQSFSDTYFEDVSGGRDNWLRGLHARSSSRCTIWATIDKDYAGTRSLNRLGLTNPLSLIWELVPYSFLVDWVLPIGPVLQALTAPAGLDFVGGSVSRRVSVVGTHEVQHRVPNRSGNPASHNLRYEGYSRERITGWPRPGLWVDPDPLRLRADGSDRIFKGLALSLLALPRA